MARILVTPERLRDLSGKMREAVLMIDSADARVQRAYGQLDWESRERVEVESRIAALRQQARALSAQAQAMEGLLSRKAAAFDQADRAAPSVTPQMPVIAAGTLLLVGAAVVVVGSVGTVFGLKSWSEWRMDDFRASDDAGMRKEIEDRLNTTQAGRDALKRAKELGIEIEINKNDGSYYRPGQKPAVIYIDDNDNKDMAAETFVHELQHAVQDAEGRLPDVNTLSREEYIQKNFEIEAEALIAQFHEEDQRGFGYDAGFKGFEEFEYKYELAVTTKLAELRLTRWDLTDEARQQMAQAAGKDALIELYRNGTARQSTDGKTYGEAKGEYWDMVHSPSEQKAM